MADLIGESTEAAVAAVQGENTGGGTGISGASSAGNGVHERSVTANWREAYRPRNRYPQRGPMGPSIHCCLLDNHVVVREDLAK